MYMKLYKILFSLFIELKAAEKGKKIEVSGKHGFIMKLYQFSVHTVYQLSTDLIWLSPFFFFSIQDLVMDILRVLSTPDLEVRKKTLQLALDLVSSRNVEEVSGMQSVSMFCCCFHIVAWTQIKVNIL